jgi:hypothetical protein
MLRYLIRTARDLDAAGRLLTISDSQVELGILPSLHVYPIVGGTCVLTDLAVNGNRSI